MDSGISMISRVAVSSSRFRQGKVGERLTLMGKKIKPKTGASPVWETKKIGRDFGTCQP
jgi:hypothetical protein